MLELNKTQLQLIYKALDKYIYYVNTKDMSKLLKLKGKIEKVIKSES